MNDLQNGIRDVRHMRGLGPDASAEDVRDDADAFLARKMRRRTPVDKTVAAYVSDSRWVADCPECNGGIAAWPESNEGTCLDCGAAVVVEFPPAGQMRAAVAVLLARPDEHTRHWQPHREDVQDLKVENIARGLPLGTR